MYVYIRSEPGLWTVGFYGREITGQVFTAVGVNICEECNTKSHGTVSMNDVFAKIERG